jgi:hypothetical protein
MLKNKNTYFDPTAKNKQTFSIIPKTVYKICQLPHITTKDPYNFIITVQSI